MTDNPNKELAVKPELPPADSGQKAKEPQTRMQVIRSRMHAPDIMERFAQVVGERTAGAYIADVLITVANSENLQKCTIPSIIQSALRAAALRLSCDPSTGQAWIIPYNKVATFIVGYKGYYAMALRTGRYRYINVATVYEGEWVEEDRVTGWVTIKGHRTSKKIEGYVLYFALHNAHAPGDFEKSVYMSVADIHEHAKKYNPNGYNNPKGIWKTNPEGMERKTIMRLGLVHWGYFDPHDMELLTVTDDVEPKADPGDTGTWDIESEPTKSNDLLLSEMGVDVEGTKPSPAEILASADYGGETKEDEPHAQAPDPQPESLVKMPSGLYQITPPPVPPETAPQPTGDIMTYETACNMQTRTGRKIGALSDKELKELAESLGRREKPTAKESDQLLACQIETAHRKENPRP